MNAQPIKIALSPADADAFEKRKQSPDSMFYAAGQREKERVLAAAFAEAGVDRATAQWDYTPETATINIFPAAPAEQLPVTVMLRVECRGRRVNREEWYQTQMLKAIGATLESFSPFILEKSGEAFGGSFVKRTSLTVEQYDPQERFLLASHSLPASQASAFTLDLECGFGWKRIKSPIAA